MSFFSRFFQWLPSPFRSIRRHLHIEEEWQEFKHHMRPHKGKIYLGIVLVSYPLYSQYALQFGRWAKYQLAYQVNQLLLVDQPPFQITDNL